jgi:hypothetical protein
VKLHLLSVAELEAAEAAVWYDDQLPGLGDDFLVELGLALDRIGDGPRTFPTLEYYTGQHEIRRSLLGRFPYVVVFLCRPQESVVVAVSHVRRRPLYWLERLG